MPKVIAFDTSNKKSVISKLERDLILQRRQKLIAEEKLDRFAMDNPDLMQFTFTVKTAVQNAQTPTPPPSLTAFITATANTLKAVLMFLFFGALIGGIKSPHTPLSTATSQGTDTLSKLFNDLFNTAFPALIAEPAAQCTLLFMCFYTANLAQTLYQKLPGTKFKTSQRGVFVENSKKAVLKTESITKDSPSAFTPETDNLFRGKQLFQ